MSQQSCHLKKKSLYGKDGKTSCRLEGNICKPQSNKRLESRIYKDFSKLNDNQKKILNEQKTETNISLKKIHKCQKST